MTDLPTEVLTRVGDRLLTLTNLGKVLYPSAGFTKAEVLDYYVRIAPTMLPHIRDRAMTRVRWPNGVAAPSWYEKNAPAGTPDWVRRQQVWTREELIDYVVVDEVATLAWLANLAALEMHVPQWTISNGTISSGRPGPDGVLELPADEPRPGEPLANRVVVDLDPGAGMTIVETARAALIVATRLAEDGLIPVPQTSGSKGIQVYAAIAPSRCRDAWAYVKRLNSTLAKADPGFFIAQMSVAERAGHIYVDYNQDLAARNTISPYSMRGRERPSVAAPVTWDEVAAVAGPDDLRFTPEQVLARVAEHGDLAADLLTDVRPPLPE